MRGLQIDFDEAWNILRNHNNFTTERERQQHEILVAAIDNLIDFATAEEMSMIDELPEEIDEEYYRRYGRQRGSQVANFLLGAKS